MKKTFEELNIKKRKYRVYHVYPSGGKLIDERLAEMKQQIQTTGEAEGSFLASLLGEDKLSLQETYGNLTEIMAAAVDTVRRDRRKFTFLDHIADREKPGTEKIICSFEIILGGVGSFTFYYHASSNHILTFL